MQARVSHRHYTIEQLQQRWRGRRVIYNSHFRYHGWTGYEDFGVIRPYRYYGWSVTCWATVMAKAFGNARNHIFFDQFDEAATVLDRLMNLAEAMRELAHKPVKYADWKFFHGNKPRPVATQVDVEWINPDFVTNPRAPTSPAYWRHFIQRYPNRDDGRPLDPALPDQLGGKMWASYSPIDHSKI